MNTKQKRQRPRLDRRNAIKNIDYDASVSSSSSSSSFDHSTQRERARSLDIALLSDRASFRIEGIDGEFDRICRSLGLSGPEDFAIPVAAWEARKVRSPSDHFPSSRLRDQYNSPKQSPDDGLSESFESKVRVNDELNLEIKCSQLNNGLNSAKGETRVRVSDEVKNEDDDTSRLNTFMNSVRVRWSKDGESGIKGVRPPVLAPPPAMSQSVVDNVSSTWELLESFGPHDDKNSGYPVPVKPISALKEVEKNEDVDGEIVGTQDPNGVKLIDTSVLSESCSDTSNDDNDDDPDSTIMEPQYSISPSGQFNRSITSWQKGDFLGSGSFGTVYEGFTDDGFFFAVKEVSLLDQGSQGKQSIYQLEQEISLLSQFKHENIVQYLGTDKDDGKLYIFLELVTKGSLANLYQKYQLRDSQVSAYTRQILNGLNYLHGRNVVHRDIKCANILVDVSGSVKLADFGLAKATTLNDVKSCKGTAFWMAPEVVNRKSRGYGLAADIWSLGCTVLEMLTQQVPYSHLEGMQALFRIGRGEPPPIPNSLSRDAQDFILKCLQVNPDCRPTAAQLLDHLFVKKPSSSFVGLASPLHSGLRS